MCIFVLVRRDGDSHTSYVSWLGNPWQCSSMKSEKIPKVRNIMHIKGRFEDFIVSSDGC